MEELIVTRLWMAGVVTMMLVFGIVAIVGYLRRKDRYRRYLSAGALAWREGRRQVTAC